MLKLVSAVSTRSNSFSGWVRSRPDRVAALPALLDRALIKAYPE